MSDLSIFHSSPNFFDDAFFSELEIEAATTFKNQTSSSISHQTIDSNQPETISDNDEYKETQSSQNSKRKLFTKEEDDSDMCPAPNSSEKQIKLSKYFLNTFNKYK